jgi:hypothetical protein
MEEDEAQRMYNLLDTGLGNDPPSPRTARAIELALQDANASASGADLPGADDLGENYDSEAGEGGEGGGDDGEWESAPSKKDKREKVQHESKWDGISTKGGGRDVGWSKQIKADREVRFSVLFPSCGSFAYLSQSRWLASC